MIGVEGPAYPFCCSILYLSVHRITGTETRSHQKECYTYTLFYVFAVTFSDHDHHHSNVSVFSLVCHQGLDCMHADVCLCHLLMLWRYPSPCTLLWWEFPCTCLCCCSLSLSLYCLQVFGICSLWLIYLFWRVIYFTHTYMVRSRSQKMVHMSIHSHVRLIITQSSIKVYVNQSINHVRDSQGSHFGVGPENI